MTNNYTPINIERLKGKNNILEKISMMITIITLSILGVILLMLIQKKIKEKQLFYESSEGKMKFVLPTKPSFLTPTPTLTPALEKSSSFEEMKKSTGSSEFNNENNLLISPPQSTNSTNSSEVKNND